jgi:uncharacterized protein YozE (UPF0346 family)
MQVETIQTQRCFSGGILTSQPPTFYTFLRRRLLKQDALGDLARAIAKDKLAPKRVNDDLACWLDYLTRKGANEETFKEVKEAWSYYVSQNSIPEHHLPAFDAQHFDPPALQCADPECRSVLLHQFGVEVFHREEDAKTGLHVAIDELAHTVDANLEGNPSSRRDGMLVRFRCEECGGISTLSIVQHKGLTFMDLTHAPLDEDDEATY